MSALFSASIIPAVPIEAVPDNAAIATDTTDRIVCSSTLLAQMLADLARELSDRTLTVWQLGGVRS
jgi:hypothetical protein